MGNPWHDISVGKKSPKVINMIVEIPRDSSIKYELDKDSGLLKLDRYLFSPMHYPGDYGFVPQTLWDDGDPLDVLVFTQRPTYPLTLCEVRIIGVVRMMDGKEQDDKLLAVHENDPRFKDWKSIDDIPEHFLKEVKHFLETYKELEGKIVKVFRILGPRDAWKDVEKGHALYRKKFAK